MKITARSKINEWLDKLAGWLGLSPPPVPIPVRKRPRGAKHYEDHKRS